MTVEIILTIMVLVFATFSVVILNVWLWADKKYKEMISNLQNNYNHCYQSYHKMTLISLMMMLKTTSDESMFKNTLEALIQLGADPDRLNDEYSINQYINELVSEKEIEIKNIKVGKNENII